MQGIGHGQHHMAIRYPLIERPPDVGDPLIHVYLAAGEAEAALAAEGHAFLFQAVRAQIRRIARLHGATAEHFVDDGLHVAILVPRMALLEGLPVIAEDLLEGVFVDPLSVMCHGRWLYHTLPLGSTCLPSLPCAPPWSLERGTQGQHNKEILIRYIYPMTKTLIGYARCSTDKQDLAAQQAMLEELGVAPDRIYMDRGLTGTTRDRPGLDQALAAVRAGDTLVVPKLDRLARSVPDARDIGDTLVTRGVRLSLGGTLYDPADPMSKMFFNMLAVFAEFEADLLKMRTREGMATARARGKLKGKKPKLTARQQAELVRMHATGEHTIADLTEVFSV